MKSKFLNLKAFWVITLMATVLVGPPLVYAATVASNVPQHRVSNFRFVDAENQSNIGMYDSGYGIYCIRKVSNQPNNNWTCAQVR